jgi:hypothetical protein
MRYINMVRCLVLLLLSIESISCKEVRKKILPSFNVRIPDITLSIPPITFISNREVPVGALRTQINLDSVIKANTAGTLGASAVSSVLVKKVEVVLLNADRNNNLGNFETARMKIYSNRDTAAVDVAVINFPDKDLDSLTVVKGGGPEISEYLKGSELGYNLYWKNRRTTNKTLKLVLSVTLSVQ